MVVNRNKKTYLVFNKIRFSITLRSDL